MMLLISAVYGQIFLEAFLIFQLSVPMSHLISIFPLILYKFQNLFCCFAVGFPNFQSSFLRMIGISTYTEVIFHEQIYLSFSILIFFSTTVNAHAFLKSIVIVSNFRIHVTHDMSSCRGTLSIVRCSCL